jgi:hypothetical protein
LLLKMIIMWCLVLNGSGLYESDHEVMVRCPGSDGTLTREAMKFGRRMKCILVTFVPTFVVPKLIYILK